MSRMHVRLWNVGGKRAWRLPCVTLLLAALALLVHAAPTLAGRLEWTDAPGGAWRSLTCHWTHFSGPHLLWSTAAFVVLGGVAELRSRARMVACVVAAAAAIGAAVHSGLIDLAAYRGLSGIDSALFVLVAVDELITSRRTADRATAAWAIAGLVLLTGKTAFEMRTGGTLFADVTSLGVTPVPAAHAVGGVVGLIVAVVPTPAPRATPREGRRENVNPMPM
jgi:rhomboid family GlyGly-CTERM serine protease